MKSISDSQKELTSQYHIGPLPEAIKIISDQIYKEKNINLVTGADGQYLFQGMEEVNSIASNWMVKILEKYRKAIDNIIAEILALKKKLCEGELFQMKINSTILKEKDPKSKEYCEFIAEELNHPNELVLLYRAS